MPRRMPTTLRLRFSRSSPRRKPPPSRSQSAAAVPEIDTPSRTVRPPFRLFDPFSAGLLRFQPNGSSTAPVHTPVATEFNPGERHYDTTNLPPPSIRKSGKISAAANLAIFCAKFAPHNHVIRASAALLFRLLFLINVFVQNFANQPTAPYGRGNLSFQSNCASVSRSGLNRPFHVKLRWW